MLNALTSWFGVAVLTKPVLVTGGTGTLGRHLIPALLRNKRRYGISRIRVLSRDWLKQEQMENDFAGDPIDYMIGDVRDRDRVKEAAKGCSTVFHLAAFKSVDKAEYDPSECKATNLDGTQSVIWAVKELDTISKAIFISTDKAVEPENFYGCTKLAAEKLWQQANIGSHGTKFSCVRYGNVFGSHGSVVEKWLSSPIQLITDENMTRFYILPEKAVDLILESFELMQGGEVFIPKMKSTDLSTLHRAVIGDKGSVKIVGVRPGEKMHECLISKNEAHRATEANGLYILWPSHNLFPTRKFGKPVDLNRDGYTSEVAERFTLEELKEMAE